MKKVLFIIMLCAISIAANAQVGGIQYQTFGNSGQSYQNNSNAQTTRTTAYYYDSYSRQYIKMPIKVAVTANSLGQVQIKAVEKYVSTGMGGSWQKTSPTYATQCMGMLSQDPLEQQFMYKIMIDGKWCYFDI